MSQGTGRRAESSEYFSRTIAVAIIGVLTTTALPNFILYRDRAQIVATLASGTLGALATAAANHLNNLFPLNAKITNTPGRN